MCSQKQIFKSGVYLGGRHWDMSPLGGALPPSCLLRWRNYFFCYCALNRTQYWRRHGPLRASYAFLTGDILKILIILNLLKYIDKIKNIDRSKEVSQKCQQNIDPRPCHKKGQQKTPRGRSAACWGPVVPFRPGALKGKLPPWRFLNTPLDLSKNHVPLKLNNTRFVSHYKANLVM